MELSSKKQAYLSKRYIYYKFFSSLFFFSAVWLYFYRLFITDQQVGILDAIAFSIGLLAEVPSGALADRYGRARMVRLGYILIAFGICFQAANSSFTPFVLGQVVMMVGFAFISGADEALFFEKLQFKQESPSWRKLVTRGSQASLIAGVVATLVGGFVNGVNPRLPWFLSAASMLCAALVIMPIKDAKVKKAATSISSSIKEYGRTIANGFRSFKKLPLSLYVPLIVTLQGIFYVAGFGLLKPVLLDRFTFSPLLGSVVVASCSLVTVGVLAYMHKNAHKLSEKTVLATIAVSTTLVLFMSAANVGKWGYVVLLVLYAGEHILHPFMSEIVNYHSTEKERATTLSVASFLKSVPYVFLAPLIGYLNNKSQLHYFLIIWAVLILVALVVYISKIKSDTKIELK